MNDILRLCGITLCAAALTLLIKQTRPEFAPVVTAAASVILLTSAVVTLTPVADTVRSLLDGSEYGEYLGVMFKALGITLASATVADMCRDMGEGALGAKIELIAKAEIMLLSMPLLERMIKLCGELLA